MRSPCARRTHSRHACCARPSQRDAAVREEEAAALVRAEIAANADKDERIAALEAQLVAEADAKTEAQAHAAEAKAHAAEAEAHAAEAEAKLAEGFLPSARKTLGDIANTIKGKLLK